MAILNINNDNIFFSIEELCYIFQIRPDQVKEMRLNYLKNQRDFLDDKIELYEVWLENSTNELERSCIFELINIIEKKLKPINAEIKSIIEVFTKGIKNNFEEGCQIINKADLVSILEFEFGLVREKENSKWIWFKSPFADGVKPHLRVDKQGKWANTGIDDRGLGFVNTTTIFKQFGYFNWKQIVEICKKYS